MRKIILIVAILTPLCIVAKGKKISYRKLAENLKKSPRYMVGVGEVPYTGNDVEARDAAREKARSELAKQISVHITSSLTSIIKETGGEITTDVQSITQSTAERTLTGIKIYKEGIDYKNKVAWAIAVLDRMEESERIGRDVREAYRNAGKFFNDGKSNLKEGYFFAGLRMLLRAREELLKGMALESEYSIIAGKLAGLENLNKPFSLSDVDIEINNAITGVNIRKISGDNQSTSVGEGLSKPLEILVYRESGGTEIPLRDVTCKFYFVTGNGQLDRKVKTDANGVARSKVYRVFKASPTNIVEVKIDINELAKSLEDTLGKHFDVANVLSPLKNIKTRFTFAVSGIKVLVRIVEKNLDVPRSESIVETRIIKFLNETGKYSVIEKSQAHDIMGLSSAESIFYGDIGLAKELARRVNAKYILTGVANTEYLGDEIYIPGQGYQKFGPQCNANIIVKCIDITTGEVKMSADVSGIKAFGKSKEEAGLKALEKATKAIIEKLQNQL